MHHNSFAKHYTYKLMSGPWGRSPSNFWWLELVPKTFICWSRSL